MLLRAQPDEIMARGTSGDCERDCDLPIAGTKILDYRGISVKAEIRAEAERRACLFVPE